MDFRIAPLLLVIINCLLLAFNVYDSFFNNNGLHWKQIGVAALILLMANGAYRSHHFFTKNYKLAFWLLFILNALMLILLLGKYFLPFIIIQ